MSLLFVVVSTERQHEKIDQQFQPTLHGNSNLSNFLGSFCAESNVPGLNSETGGRRPQLTSLDHRLHLLLELPELLEVRVYQNGQLLPSTTFIPTRATLAWTMGALLSIPLLTGGVGALGSSLFSGCLFFMGQSSLTRPKAWSMLIPLHRRNSRLGIL
jgi:hypothetical protein